MTENHKKALHKLKEIHEADNDMLALILCGSLAVGDAGEKSDIDLYLVVSDEKYRLIEKDKLFFYGTWDPDDFFGVEIDGKIISRLFLEKAVTEASEPTRASFEKAYTLFSRDRSIDNLIKEIAVYPEWNQSRKARAFYSYTKHYRYVGEDAFRSGNVFLIKDCVLNLVFFAGRLVLAHNRILFPCRKSLFKALTKCSLMPDNFIEMSRHLIDRMDMEIMIDYYDKAARFFEQYDFPDKQRVGLILENEWTWFTGKLTISEW